MKINSNFDSGNIEVVSYESDETVILKIRPDTAAKFKQWFHFKAHCQPLKTYILKITELADSSYPKGWEDYQAVASYDTNEWFRVDTTFDGDCLSISITPEYDHIYIAYFAPYSYQRHLQLIAQSQMQFDCRHTLLGESIDGREINLLTVGDENATGNNIWIIARQHPGESMAEWLIEGLLQRLLDDEDGVARSLLAQHVFYIVPNMNPDGAYRGHLRTNTAGKDLNREWANPTPKGSPEVYCVLQKMRETGVDMFLDVHGDEALPYNFVAGTEGNPNYSERIEALESAFKAQLMATTPEFQDVHGYPKDLPGQSNLTIACNAVGNYFNCLSYTLEQPFKDNNDLPDPAYGWSPTRCKQLGKDLLVAIRAVADDLR
ncbi:MAG: M14-type cytosolic carboxypeptidase [Pseudomonadota bacterium]